MKTSIIAVGLALVLGVMSIPLVWSDDDDDHGKWYEYSRASTGVAYLENAQYQQECGGCHMAYPPGLLTAVSWEKVMSGLDDHFGDNAELDSDTHVSISEFLDANSADKSDYRRSRHFAKNDKGEVITRITESDYFRHEHHEIPAYMVRENKDVMSFSNCNACHRRAEQASFRERDILIPGYGRWDD